MAISAHDDEIRRDIRRVGQDGVCHIRFPGDDPLAVDVEIMVSQMTCDVGTRRVITFEWFSRHNNELDGFGAVEKWECIRNGTRCLAPSVPAHQNAIEREPSLLDVGHDHYRSS